MTRRALMRMRAGFIIAALRSAVQPIDRPSGPVHFVVAPEGRLIVALLILLISKIPYPGDLNGR